MGENTDSKKYGKLLGAADYDHEAAEQLADALNEIVEHEQRAGQLKQIVEENKELHQFVWRQANGEVIAICNLEDDHLSNIMLHLLRTGHAVPRAIRGEAMKRNLVIPVKVPIDWKDELRGLPIDASVGF